MTTRKRRYVINRFNQIQKMKEERMEEEIENRKNEKLGKNSVGGDELKRMIESGNLPDN